MSKHFLPENQKKRNTNSEYVALKILKVFHQLILFSIQFFQLLSPLMFLGPEPGSIVLALTGSHRRSVTLAVGSPAKTCGS